MRPDAFQVRPRDVMQQAVCEIYRIERHPDGDAVGRVQFEIVVILVRRGVERVARDLVEVPVSSI